MMEQSKPNGPYRFAGAWRDCCNSGRNEEHEKSCREGGEARWLCEHDLDLRVHPRCYLCQPEEKQ